METQRKGIRMEGQILLNGKKAGFGRIFGMETGDNVRSVSKFISKPPDQIKKFTDTVSVIQFRVENL